MSFSVVLMNNKSENIRVDKDITTLSTHSCTLKQNTEIISPTIILKANLADVAKANYVYISDFKRYYYINNTISLAGGLVEIRCSVDVLMSFKNIIRSNNAIVKRQESMNNLYFNDGSFNCYQNPHIITKSFPRGFNPSAQNYILTVAGGIAESN